MAKGGALIAPAAKPPVVTFMSHSTVFWGAERSLSTVLSHWPGSASEPFLVCASAELAAACASTPAHVSARVEGSALRWWASLPRDVRSRTWASSSVVLFSLSLLPLAPLLRLRGLRVVLDLHDYLPTRFGRLKIRFASLFCHDVVSVSTFVQSQLPPRRRTAAPPAMRPIAPLSPATTSLDTCLRVGVVGRLDPDKNLELVLDVARRMPETRFLLRGEPARGNEQYAFALQGQVECQGLSNVTFEGRVPAARVLDDVDVLLSTNPREALGRNVLEAMLCGIPAVTPSTGGAGELISRFGGGVAYSELNPEEVVDALRRAATASATGDSTLALLNQVTDPWSYSRAYQARVTARENSQR